MSVGVLLRVEGLAIAVAAILVYVDGPHSWWLFAVLIAAPDLAFVAYYRGPRLGAVAYNLTHNLVLPIAVGTMGVLSESEPTKAVALLWLAHIGADRLLGYGLKYPTAFKDTHMQRV
jgi:Domain of unknown function (DUF4260)